MEFAFETVYDQKTVTAMVRALRKTQRKKHSRRSHIFGGVVIALGALLLVADLLEGKPLDAGMIITLLAVLTILIVLLFEDSINACIARKRTLPGLVKNTVVFTEDGYRSSTEMGNTEWFYENILSIAETPGYFVFFFSKNHAQIYDKATLTGGSAEDFRSFLAQRTGKEVVFVR